MPSWLIDLLLKLALNFGIPYLISKFPWIPTSIADVLKELVDNITSAKKTQRAAISQAKRVAHAKLRRGIGSPPKTV